MGPRLRPRTACARRGCPHRLPARTGSTDRRRSGLPAGRPPTTPCGPLSRPTWSGRAGAANVSAIPCLGRGECREEPPSDSRAIWRARTPASAVPVPDRRAADPGRVFASSGRRLSVNSGRRSPFGFGRSSAARTRSRAYSNRMERRRPATPSGSSGSRVPSHGAAPWRCRSTDCRLQRPAWGPSTRAP